MRAIVHIYILIIIGRSDNPILGTKRVHASKPKSGMYSIRGLYLRPGFYLMIYKACIV